jgi:hypothetical protein
MPANGAQGIRPVEFFLGVCFEVAFWRSRLTQRCHPEPSRSWVRDLLLGLEGRDFQSRHKRRRAVRSVHSGRLSGTPYLLRCLTSSPRACRMGAICDPAPLQSPRLVQIDIFVMPGKKLTRGSRSCLFRKLNALAMLRVVFLPVRELFLDSVAHLDPIFRRHGDVPAVE